MTALIRYGLYPLMFLSTLAYAAFELARPPDKLGSAYAVYLILLVSMMLVMEWLFPLRSQWRMTWRTLLRRDVPFMLVGGLTMVVVNYLAGMFILHADMQRGDWLSALPLLPSVVLALVIPDFFWYWVHRYSHEGKGRLGNWFWRMHVAHHLPQQVYVMMHAVFHPINFLIVRLLLTLPLYLLGFSLESLFVAQLIVGLQGLVSHFNVDIRAGWLNYVFIGTELHRYHHSADPQEGKNYGAVVSCWDLLFGTFQYLPGRAPDVLGVSDPGLYPEDVEFWRVMKLPFA